MSEDNIIQFPFGEIRNPLVDPGLPTEVDIASDMLEAMLNVLIDAEYHPRADTQLQQDLGLILNLLYAIMARVHGKEHFLHGVIDELSLTLSEIKEELENDNH
jgi:hypothetical protein